MIDINAVRANAEILREALKKRNKPDITDELLEKHGNYLKLVTKLQQHQETRNKITADFAKAKKNGEDTEVLSIQMQTLKADIAEATQAADTAKAKYEEILFAIPNIPSQDCPVGPDETYNSVIKKVGVPREFSFKPKAHQDLGEKLGMMDFKKAAKIAGSRFVFLFSELARLERALMNFMLDCHKKNGYIETYVPLLLDGHAMFGTGQLPKFEEDLFKTTVASYLIPTAEASLTNIYNGEIINSELLPLRFTAYTPCFRSEAGAAGKDTTGMIRQHQFGKVELVSITKPEESIREHERMTLCAEEILEKLGLPYQRVLLSTGDMGFSSEKTYDLEVWMPSQMQYREISSCSRCGDFQARRMNTRFKGEQKNEFVHTLNGSGVAVGRCMIAIMENYQEEDGSITIPEALVPYFDNQKSICPK